MASIYRKHYDHLKESPNFTYVHIWRQRQSFDKEHRVLKNLLVWLITAQPANLNQLLESGRDETAVWAHFNVQRLSGGVHEESNWRIFARILDCELGNKGPLLLPKYQLRMRVDINEVRTNVDSRLESEFVSP